MFTPTGFFASAEAPGPPGPPNVYLSSDWYYDANMSTTFTDQSGNGNNGSITTAGSGGGSAITHTGGATPYWEFTATNPGSEQKYLDTGYNTGTVTGSFSLMMIVADTELLNNAQFLWARDGANDEIFFFTSRSDNTFFARTSVGSRFDINPASPVTVSDQLYFVIYVNDKTNEEMQMYINNTLVGTRAMAASYNLSVVDNMSIGLPFVNATTTNEFNVAAAGWWKNYYLDSADRTALYNHYNDIYSF